MGKSELIKVNLKLWFLHQHICVSNISVTVCLYNHVLNKYFLFLFFNMFSLVSGWLMCEVQPEWVKKAFGFVFNVSNAWNKFKFKPSETTVATSLQFYEFYARKVVSWQRHLLTKTLFVALIPNYNWTRLFMYFSSAVLFGAVSHVVSIGLGVLRRDTEQNTKSSSYRADLPFSHCRKSQSEHSSVHLNASTAGQYSLPNSCLPHTEAWTTLWTTAFIALLLLSKIRRRADATSGLLVYRHLGCFPLVAGIQNRLWREYKTGYDGPPFIYCSENTKMAEEKKSIINNSMRS